MEKYLMIWEIFLTFKRCALSSVWILSTEDLILGVNPDYNSSELWPLCPNCHHLYWVNLTPTWMLDNSGGWNYQFLKE